nr:UbiA family prenyltransferase [Gemmatimonadales bacterium]
MTRLEGQTFAGRSMLIRYANLVKLPHTLFALPFALLGVLAASVSAPVTLRTVLLVVLAFSAARWAAMGFNRIADREYDARNPRTANRELPRGALT